MGFLRQDIRYTFRQASKRPGATIAAALVLSLGVGVVTLIFSLVNGAFLRPLPFEDSHRLRVLERVEPKTGNPTSFWTVEWPVIQSAAQSFEPLAGFSWSDRFELMDLDRSVRQYRGSRVTANLLDVLRAKPLIGRWFRTTEEQPGSPPLVVLSYRAWRRDFQGDPGVVGRAVRLDGEPATVIGVMPDGFHFPYNQDIWRNLRWDRMMADTLTPIGRLRADASPKAARAELEVLVPQWAQDLASRFSGRLKKMSNWDATETEYLLAEVRKHEGYSRVRPIRFIDSANHGSSIWVGWGLLTLGLCVLLIACGNVMTLLCARASTRVREIAVRTALGASRGRLIVQMLLESTLLATLGAAGGVSLSVWGARSLSLYLARRPEYPFWFRLVHDWRVFAFVSIVLVLSGIVSGLIPALRSTRCDVGGVLKNSGNAHTGLHIGRLHRLLVIGEVALSIPLLLVAGAMIKTAMVARSSFVADDPGQVLTARIDLQFSPPSPGAETLMRRLEALPGVQSTALTEWDAGCPRRRVPVELPNQAPTVMDESPSAFVEVISPGYLHTLSVGLLRGRDFAVTDTFDSRRVAIVNEPFASEHWPGETPLGRRFKCRMGGHDEWLTVVGIAPDLRMHGTQTNRYDSCGFYLPHAQRPHSQMTVLLRVQGDPLALAPALQRAIHALIPDRPVPSIVPLSTALAQAAGPVQAFSSLFGLFGLAALFLAAVGVAGITSFTVSQRTREFGVRMAMGATAAGVLSVVLREVAARLTVGLVLGLVLAGIAGRLVTSRLTTAVSPYDPAIGGVVILTVAIVAWLAAWIPARRAARTDPMVALRHE